MYVQKTQKAFDLEMTNFDTSNLLEDCEIIKMIDGN